MADNERTAELVRKLAALPMFPPTAVGLLGISAESDTAIEDYERAFKSDPALAADLFRAANSAEFGLVDRIESVRQAITLLGLDRVRNLALTVALGRYARQLPTSTVVRPFLTHSVSVAVIAEELARIRSFSTTGFYTAGLVHDIGRLGLISSVDGYAQSLIRLAVGSQAALDLEIEQHGLSHTEAGGVISRSWRFPEWICQAIRSHHASSEPAETDSRSRLIQLACAYASAIGYPEPGERNIQTAFSFELPADFRGRPTLEPERLRQRTVQMLLAVGHVKNY